MLPSACFSAPTGQECQRMSLSLSHTVHSVSLLLGMTIEPSCAFKKKICFNRTGNVNSLSGPI